MTEVKIAVHTVNNGLIGLAALSEDIGGTAAVVAVPGGGRMLIDAPDVLIRVTDLLGPNAQATNPYEQRRKKEFLRRARRSLTIRSATVVQS